MKAEHEESVMGCGCLVVLLVIAAFVAAPVLHWLRLWWAWWLP